ncbi:MAG: hypothetical protein E7J94_01640 [Clostridium sp.]|nr:hypothetical protein [Clostridium sp.]
MITLFALVFLLFYPTPANSPNYASRHPYARFTGLDASRRQEKTIFLGESTGEVDLDWLG